MQPWNYQAFFLEGIFQFIGALQPCAFLQQTLTVALFTVLKVCCESVDGTIFQNSKYSL